MRATQIAPTESPFKTTLPAAIESSVIAYLGRCHRLRPLVAIVIAQAIGLGAR